VTKQKGGRTNFDVEVIDDEAEAEVRVVVAGEIDIATAPEFESQVMRALEQGRPVVVDLSGTKFMDSTGLSAIVRIVSHLGERPDAPDLVLDSPSPPVAKTLQISGVHRLVTIRGDAQN
jgi:anti-sigma B factor antagonist